MHARREILSAGTPGNQDTGAGLQEDQSEISWRLFLLMMALIGQRGRGTSEERKKGRMKPVRRWRTFITIWRDSWGGHCEWIEKFNHHLVYNLLHLRLKYESAVLEHSNPPRGAENLVARSTNMRRQNLVARIARWLGKESNGRKCVERVSIITYIIWVHKTVMIDHHPKSSLHFKILFINYYGKAWCARNYDSPAAFVIEAWTVVLLRLVGTCCSGLCPPLAQLLGCE